MLSYKTLLSVFENIVNNKYAVKDYNEEYFNYVNVNNFIEMVNIMNSADESHLQKQFFEYLIKLDL